MSVNIESPEADLLRSISPHKDLQKDILDPMAWIDELTRDTRGGAVGQATQFVVGAAEESDRQIYRRVDQMYTDWNLKRVYYPPFRPAWETPMEEHPPVPAAGNIAFTRWTGCAACINSVLTRLTWPLTTAGSCRWSRSPKTVIAMENLDAFPMDLNSVAKIQLLRIPGIGPISADRIMQNRRLHSIDNWRDLQAMGVVRKRAWPYVVFPGQRPPSGKQLRLDLFGEAQDRRNRRGRGIDAAATNLAAAGRRHRRCAIRRRNRPRLHPRQQRRNMRRLPGEPGNSMNPRIIPLRERSVLGGQAPVV